MTNAIPTVPHLGKSVPDLHQLGGEQGRNRTPRYRSPLLRAPYRARRWGTGNGPAMFPNPGREHGMVGNGSFPSLRRFDARHMTRNAAKSLGKVAHVS